MNKFNLVSDEVKMLAKMANSADPDQTAPKEQSDQDLHCLLEDFCPNT